MPLAEAPGARASPTRRLQELLSAAALQLGLSLQGPASCCAALFAMQLGRETFARATHTMIPAIQRPLQLNHSKASQFPHLTSQPSLKNTLTPIIQLVCGWKTLVQVILLEPSSVKDAWVKCHLQPPQGLTQRLQRGGIGYTEAVRRTECIARHHRHQRRFDEVPAALQLAKPRMTVQRNLEHLLYLSQWYTLHPAIPDESRHIRGLPLA